MTSLQVSIDASGARQGAREFARSAEDIRRAAGAAEESIRKVEGAFDRLRKSFFEGMPAMARGLPAYGPAGPLGASFLAREGLATRGELLTFARSSDQEVSSAVRGFLKRDPTMLESLLDEAVEAIDSLGGALDLLGDDVGETARRFNLLGTAAKVLRLFLQPLFEQPRTAEEAFQAVNDFNAAIPGLRELSEQATGTAKRAVELLLVEFEAAAVDAVDLITDSFSRNLAAVTDPRAGGREAEAEFRRLIEFLESTSRVAVDPQTRDRVRGTLEVNELDFARNPQAPFQRAMFAGDPIGSPDAPNGAFVDSLFRDMDLRPEIDASTDAQNRLNRSMADGLRSNRALAEEARTAFEAYAEAATDAGVQIEQAIGGALGGLEDALVGFVQTGKLEWKSLIDSMIADLIRLFIRAQILGPLAQGLGGLFTGGGLVGSIPGATFTAQGAAFEDGRRLAFARGGVVGRPTLFPLARGIGLMGEAGPEAILPLKRLPGGDLGVRAAGGGAVFNQTIVNEAGVEIETEERPNATGGIDQLLVLVRKDAERQMLEGRLGRLTAQRFGLSDRPVGR